MTELPAWNVIGVVPIDNDLSVLESALHSARVSAAERGYQDEPTIGTDEVMIVDAADAEPRYLSAGEADEAGIEFRPTHTRYRLDWAAEA